MPHFQAIGQWNEKTSNTDYLLPEYRGCFLLSTANRACWTPYPERDTIPDTNGSPKNPTSAPTPKPVKG